MKKYVFLVMLCGLLVGCGQQAAVVKPQAEISRHFLDYTQPHKWTVTGAVKNTGTVPIHVAVVQVDFTERSSADKYSKLASAVVVDILPDQEKEFLVVISAPPAFTDTEEILVHITDLK